MNSAGIKLTFLGTGGSLGVPVIGCKCEVCTSVDHRNTRTRPSVWLQYNDNDVVIDISPDFRMQALNAGIRKIDSIIFTHAHADHILGLDDVRIIVERMQRQIPVYGSRETINRLEEIFGYIFKQPIWRTDIPRFASFNIDGAFELYGQEFIPVPVEHEDMVVFGYRFGNAAYITDVSGIPETSMELLTGLDLLIFSALRPRPHPKHFSVDQALEVIEKLKPGRVLLTHISHELEHTSLDDYLPDNVSPAYDGLTVEL